jgi:hypothetical protein
MKIQLARTSGVKRQIFVDSDDLTDLDKLFDYVASETETLVCIRSSELLCRPWCVGEICTATVKRTPIMQIAFKGFPPVDDDFIRDFADRVNTAVLVERNLSVPVIQEALRYFRTTPCVTSPTDLSQPLVDALCTKVVLISKEVNNKKVGNKANSIELDVDSQKSLKGENTFWIISDTTNFEAVAAALVLRTYLLPLKVNDADPTNTPTVLLKDQQVPKSVETAVIICTPGLIDSSLFLRSLLVAGDALASVLPVFCDDAFKVPMEPDLIQRKPILVAQFGDEAESLIDLIIQIFTNIAVAFHPNRASTTELEAKAKVISTRTARENTNVSKKLSKSLSGVSSRSSLSGGMRTEHEELIVIV